MSATINSGKLKFSVFGNGFENTRNDSGSGIVNSEADILAYSGAIDNTNTYCWLVTSNGLKKYRIHGMVEVEQSTVPTTAIKIIHPSNVDNNIGIAFVGGDTAYIFNLTDDTLIGTVSGTFPTSASYSWYDCAFVNNKIYYVQKHIGNTNIDLNCIDLSDMSYSTSRIYGSVGCNGFINDSMLYVVYTREWFYQNSTAFGITFSGSNVWSNTGIDRNSNIDAWGLVGNGYLYLPVQIDGAWHFGVFDGTSNPDFTPSPIRTFGNFESDPTLVTSTHPYDHKVEYSNGKTKACMFTAEGLLITDFQTVSKLDDVSAYPLAVSNKFVICADSDVWNQKVYIYGV